MPDITEFLRQAIAGVSNVPLPRIEPTARFDQLPRWGSLSSLQLLTAIEREYAVDFQVREYLALETVADLAQAIMARIGRAEAAPGGPAPAVRG